MTTYAQAHRDLQDHMESTDEWEVHLMSKHGYKVLKVPYAQHRYSDVRVWFKKQALYIGQTSILNDARSLDQLASYDIRRETPQQTLARIERDIED